LLEAPARAVSRKSLRTGFSALKKRKGVDARLLDLRDFPMPFFDQPLTPAMPGRPPFEHEWFAMDRAIAQSDASSSSPEYNFGPRGAQERDRLGLSGVASQGGLLRELRLPMACAACSSSAKT